MQKINGQLCFIEAMNERKPENVYKTILKERVALYGVESLQNEEILNVLTGISIEKIRKFLDNYGLVDLIKYIDTMDITMNQKKKLSLLYSLCNRMAIAPFIERMKIDSSSAAGRFFAEDLKFQAVELFKVMLLDNQNQIISVDLASKGTVNEAPVYVREIVKNALNKNAVSLIFGHNHPGGSTKPSNPDIQITKQLKAACDTVKIKVLDHIIVCPNGRFTSMAEIGLL